MTAMDSNHSQNVSYDTSSKRASRVPSGGVPVLPTNVPPPVSLTVAKWPCMHSNRMFGVIPDVYFHWFHIFAAV